MDKQKILEYFPPTDYSYNIFLEKSVEKANTLLKNDEFDLFEILNLYVVNLFLKDFNKFNDKQKEITKNIINCKGKINSILGNFFEKIDGNNFCEILKQVKGDKHSKEILFACLVKYNVFDRISDSTFLMSLNNDTTLIEFAIKYKKIVAKYETILKTLLLKDKNTALYLVKKYDYNESNCIFLPNFSVEEKEKIISNYLELENINLYYLNALLDHRPSIDSYELTSAQRLKIKKIVEKKIEENITKSPKYFLEFSIKYDKMKDSPILNINNNKSIFTMPCKWIDEHLDYQTLFSNFVTILQLVDYDINFINIANIDKESVFLRYMYVSNKTNYIFGKVFEFNERYFSSIFFSYIDYLKNEHGIYIEKMIEWFFNVYLQEKFNIKNFNITLSTDEEYINRCKSLFPEFDSLLKKFYLYSKYKYIDDELLEASRESIKIDDCPSLIANKYLIINQDNPEIKNILYLLFNSQSLISYLDNNIDEPNFVDLILRHKIKLSDFQNSKSRFECISYLLKKEIIYLENEIIKIKDEVLVVCKYLYENKFLRNHNTTIEKEFVKKGYVVYYTKLFSPQESDYLNYYLNNSKFGNSLGLSNKYRHSNTTSKNKKIIIDDYIIGLRLFVLIILKIYDEFSTNHS